MLIARLAREPKETGISRFCPWDFFLARQRRESKSAPGGRCRASFLLLVIVTYLHGEVTGSRCQDRLFK